MESTLLYLVSLSIILSLTTALFFIAQIKKDNSIIDVAYGLTFVITAYILASQMMETQILAPASMLILILISIWGIRLAFRIYTKNKGKPEDFRYKEWRSSWMQKGLGYYFTRAYFQIFILQGLIISIVLLPFTLSLTTSAQPNKLLLVGLTLWILGFFFEAFGDKQLDAFIKNKNKVGTIMKTGLWKYTRHPNYFGESTMWFGIAFIVYASGVSFFVFLSPFLITYLLIFVSGIPLLEKKWSGIPEWEVYKKKTSPFFPLPPKQIS